MSANCIAKTDKKYIEFLRFFILYGEKPIVKGTRNFTPGSGAKLTGGDLPVSNSPNCNTYPDSEQLHQEGVLLYHQKMMGFTTFTIKTMANNQEIEAS